MTFTKVDDFIRKQFRVRDCNLSSIWVKLWNNSLVPWKMWKL